MGQNFALLTPCEKREGWWRCLYKLFVPYKVLCTGILFARRQSAVWSHVGWLTKKEEDEPRVKRIASGNFIAGS